MKRERESKYINIIILCLAVLAVLFISWTFTGKWPWIGHAYDSYMLQARSWLEGRLDLGRNYPHLELAIYPAPPDVDGVIPDYCKYYVSFPPFPSFLMFPFALMHWYTADGFIAVVSAMAGAIYAYKIMQYYNISDDRAMFFALFLTIGSNWLFTAQAAWVWFIAQNLVFTLSLMALYYVLKGKLGLSLAFWACAVGCRPLQVLYLPVILYLFYTDYKEKNPEDKLVDVVKKNILSVIPMVVIALAYMALNFARFGNPIEFGHNYLPEFARTSTGQFNIAYMKENLSHLFRLPNISFKKAWEYQDFDGWCLLMTSPIFISYIVYSVYAVKTKRIKPIYAALVFVMLVTEMILTTAHKTMGGAQFGNRYINDVLPLAFVGLAAALTEKNTWEKLNYVLFFWGFSLNLIGSVLFFV